METHAVLELAGVAADEWLGMSDARIEQEIAGKLIRQLDEPAFFLEKLEKIGRERSSEIRMKAYLNLFQEVARVLEIQEKLCFFDVEAVKLAYADMKKMPGFEAARYEKFMLGFGQEIQAARREFYSGNREAGERLNKVFETAQDMLFGKSFVA